MLQGCSFCGPVEASVAKKVAAHSRAIELLAARSLAAAPTPALSPCAEYDDYAEVGSTEGDSCKEAKVQLEVSQQTVAHQKLVVEAFQTMFQQCGTGQYNLDCVARVAYSDRPEEYLEKCNSAMGPQATASGAVCRFAKEQLDYYRKSLLGMTNLVKVLKWSKDSCRSVPYECIASSDVCLKSQDIQFCFLECIKKGNMKHEMLNKARTPKSAGCLDFSR